MRIALAVAAVAALHAPAAAAAEITIGDGKTQPESITVGPDGSVIAGSFTTPVISIIPKGSATARPFVDLTAEGTGSFLGVLADEASNTLWACYLTPAATGNGRRSSLRGFDLRTGAPKLRWDLPGDTSNCNDFSVAPDKSLYIADTGGKIYRLPAGAQSGTLVSDDKAFAGADGIAFLDGRLYVNSIFSGKLYRLPVDATGKGGTPVEISLHAPLGRPDGMRSANGRLFVGEGGAGKVTALTIAGDTAHAVVVKDGLQRPTAVQPAGDLLWYSELTPGRVSSIPMPK